MGGADTALEFDAFTLSPTQGLTRAGTELRVTRKSLRVL